MSECWHYIQFVTISDGTITGMHCNCKNDVDLITVDLIGVDLVPVELIQSSWYVLHGVLVLVLPLIAP